MKESKLPPKSLLSILRLHGRLLLSRSGYLLLGLLFLSQVVPAFAFSFASPLKDVEAWVDTDGYAKTVRFKVYDPWLEQWKEHSISYSGSSDAYWVIDSLTAQDGIVSWRADNHDSRYGDSADRCAEQVRCAVYDPYKGVWSINHTVISGTPSNYYTISSLSSHSGVVTWRADQAYGDDVCRREQVYCLVYDFLIGQWRKELISYNLDSGIYWTVDQLSTRDGVVVWRAYDTATGRYGHEEACFAVYNPETGSWEIEKKSYTATETSLTRVRNLTTADGLVLWRGEQWTNRYGWDSDEEIGYSVYDPVQNEWSIQKVTYPLYSSGWSTYPWVLLDLRISNHAVRWTAYRIGGVTTEYRLRGYVAQTGSWREAVNAPYAKFVVLPTSGNAPLPVYFTDMSLGGDNYIWYFGDGVTSNNKGAQSYRYTTFRRFPAWLTVVSPVGSHTTPTTYITADIEPPTGAIEVYNRRNYANTQTVRFTPQASDNSGRVSSMRFSNDGSNWSSWESYIDNKEWTLTPGDGTKTVYVQFRDSVGNVSEAYSVSLVYDTVPPVGSIDINSGAEYTNSSEVTLDLEATDERSGVWMMHFGDDGANWSFWETYSNTKTWTLPSGDGPKTVYVEYIDRSYNKNIYNKTITLDTTPANPGAASSPTYSKSNPITVSYSGASDSMSGLKKVDLWYKKGSTGTWTDSGLSSPAASGSFNFTGMSGEDTYYFGLRAEDNAGNFSPVPSGNGDCNTIYDATPPSVPGTPTGGDAFTNTTTVTFTWAPSSDSGSGIAGYICQIGTTPGGNDFFDGNVGNVTNKAIAGQKGTTYYCRVRAVDSAGNTSPWSGNNDGVAVVEHVGLSIAESKGLANSTSVGLISKVVTAIFSDCVYIAESDRSSGIRVAVHAISPGLAVGGLVDAGGAIITSPEGERLMAGTISPRTETADVKPLAMSNKHLGGGDFLLPSGYGQLGVLGGIGLNNIGQLVKTWGRVTQTDSGYLYVDDSSGVIDGTYTGSSANIGVRIICDSVEYSAGDYVVVTGISSCFSTWMGIHRQVLATDILKLE